MKDEDQQTQGNQAMSDAIQTGAEISPSPSAFPLPTSAFSPPPSTFYLLPSTFASSSPADTVALGRARAARARPGEVWALVGDLGAGKTHFVQGVVEGLGVPATTATSPTFALLHEYTGGRLPVFHVDFYRLRSSDEALGLGLDELLFGAGLTLIEWADHFPELLPAATHWFRFEILAGDERRIVES